MISVIIPTYNEAANLPILIERIFAVFKREQIDGEVVVVDDNSPDGTARLAQTLAKAYDIQVFIRRDERGLASAVLKGFEIARHNLLCVMDADLSHPPEKIPELIAPIQSGEADFVLGSRYIPGGKIEGWPFLRRFISKGARLLARPCVDVTDALSGFFCLHRTVLDGNAFQPIGYKIALELLVKGKIRSVKEIPFTFTDRLAGKSKFGLKAQWNYLRHLARLYHHRFSRRSSVRVIPDA